MISFWEQINETGFSAQEAIQVYQTNLLGTRLKALEAQFPLVKGLLGTSLFTSLTKQYALHFHSQTDSLNHYGETFPRFIEEVSPYNPRLSQITYLAELAQLDWLIGQSYFAEDEYRSLTKENSCLALAKHAYVMRSHYLKVFVEDGESEHGQTLQVLESKLPQLSNDAHANASQTIFLLVYRFDFAVHIIAISKQDYAFFLLLQAGTPLFSTESVIDKPFSPTEEANFTEKFNRFGILLEAQDVN